MKDAKHTPGPWLLAASDGVASVFALRYGEIATVDISKETETQVANTRLIAAAPELAEAIIQTAKDRASASFIEPDGLSSEQYHTLIGEHIESNWRSYLELHELAALRKAGILELENND